MRYIDIPAKVIEATALSVTPTSFWPYNGGDPYWIGGDNPQPYQWIVDLSVVAQNHSSPMTRRPYSFDAFDVNVGDYMADITDGIVVKIVSIVSKTENAMTCVVEDVVRYNTFRDPNGLGNGIFSSPNNVLIFEVNEDGLPVVDPIPQSGVGATFFANVMSRFQNIEETKNFVLDKHKHDFVTDDLISADPRTNSFVKTDSAHPYIVGAVSYDEIGPNQFMINPIQKVVDNYDYLIGDVGDILYADSANPGKFATTGSLPVMIKLRNNTRSFVVGKNEDAATSPGSIFSVNAKEMTVGGAGMISDVCDAINEFTSLHGVVATNQLKPTTAITDSSLSDVYSVMGDNPLSASINGILVEFTTNDFASSMPAWGAQFIISRDIVAAINAANIPNVEASIEGNFIRLTNRSGTAIEIVNVSSDGEGRDFAGGSSSVSGLPLLTEASETRVLYLEAVDARAINLYDTSGSVFYDMGLTSVENGQKAAALYIEQGIRQAATYVVASLAARDALDALFGDQCFVQDKGNGEWAHYIRTLENSWVKIADKDSSDTDAQTIEIEIDHESDANDVIYTVSGGSRVTFVTVTVTEQFNGVNPLISIGDADDSARLMTNDQNDLKSLGAYSTTPSYIYSGSADVDITFTFDAANSTSGKAVIVISYT